MYLGETFIDYEMLFVLLVTLVASVTAQKHPFIDVKKVIRDALDMVASMPTSTPQSLLFDRGVNKQQSILPEAARKQLSKLFHVPADFLHRLAAENGYIDYDPYTTVGPRFNLLPAQFSMVEATTAAVAGSNRRTIASAVNEEVMGAAFVQEDLPEDLKGTKDTVVQVKESRYYQPFILTPNHLPQIPQVIQSGGQTYVAVSQEQLSALPAYQSTQPTRHIPSTNSFVPENSQSSAKVSVMLPETERRIVFESEANLHAPTKTTKDDYDALLKVAENAQLHAASQQREAFSISSPLRIPAVVDAALSAIPMQKQYSLKDLEAQEYYALQQKILELNRKLKEQEFRRKQENLHSLQQQLDQQTGTAPKKPSETTTIESLADTRIDDGDNHPLKQIRISRVGVMSLQPSTDLSDQKNASFKFAISGELYLKYVQITNTPNLQCPYQHQLPLISKMQFRYIFLIESLAYEERRVETLRKKMAEDRKWFGARKLLLSSLKHKASKTDVHKKAVMSHLNILTSTQNCRPRSERAAFQLTRQHCRNIRSFARQFGILNIRKFALANCVFIENHYPELKCDQIERYIDLCYELFDM
uniref:CUT domain-containing protein n=1 Tax=Ascaris lumbricoides TaxID=6252 RepID=A0A9J2PTD8_ASCLU